MSYLKHLSIKSGTHILNSINYIKDEKKAESEYITGINCDVNRVNEDFEFAKIIHEKTDTRIIAHHYIQSFKPGEANEKIANEIGCKLIDEIAPGYQAIVVTHNDKDHIHNHIIINSVNINTGYMYKANKDSYNNALCVKDRLDKEYGLSVLDKYNNGNKGIDQATYNLGLQGKSWKVKMLNAIDEAIMFNNTKDDFVKYLEKQGYEVKYQNQNISIKDPEEQKKFIRVDTLGKQFGNQYSMKGIEARLKGVEFENIKLNESGEINGIGANGENRIIEVNEQNRNREDNIVDVGNVRNQHQYTPRGSAESEENYKNARRKRKNYTTEKDRYDKWKSEQERSIKKGISLEHIDNQLFKMGKVLGSITPSNRNKDNTQEETFKVFMAILMLFLKVRKHSKLKKAEKMRYKVLKAKANLRIGNISYEDMKNIPGENKYIKLNVSELEKLRNEATFNYTGIIKDNKITIMVKEKDLDKVLDLVGRSFEKQYGNTTYKYIKEHSEKIEFRLVDEKLLDKLKELDFKFACFKKEDKFNIAFSNNDLSKYINITKNIKEKER